MFASALLFTMVALARPSEMPKRTLPAVVLPRPPDTPDWTLVPEPVAANEPVSFTLVLHQSNVARLKDIALAVNTPGTAEYGHFLTQSDLARLTAPSQDAVRAVTRWLQQHGASYSGGAEILSVHTTAAKAASLLNTTFSRYAHTVSKRVLVRAADCTLPLEVARNVWTIFGLHGLPLPPRRQPQVGLAQASTPPATPAHVTPTVLAATYSVVNMSRPAATGPNRQAVAEFQGQLMNPTDLSMFFVQEVPLSAWRKGDDTISKFVGAPFSPGVGIEALLDVEFLMGNTAGVRTEFWAWPDDDFCGDLHNYTATLLASSSPPLVNSISYGYQGNLTDLGCGNGAVDVIDLNWAKLAARGISVMISSGDAGSQCITDMCELSQFKSAIEVKAGKLLRRMATADATMCCISAANEGARGWTWQPPATGRGAQPVIPRQAPSPHQIPSPQPRRLVEHVSPKPIGPITLDHAPFHCEISESGAKDTFPEREVYFLDGVVGSTPSVIKVHDANGTFEDTVIHFSSPWVDHLAPSFINYNLTMTTTTSSSPSVLGHLEPADAVETLSGSVQRWHGTAQTLNPRRGKANTIDEITWYQGGGTAPRPSIAAVLARGPNVGPAPPSPPPLGTCLMYQSVDSVAASSGPRTVSGGVAVTPSKVVLYPAWPASSPWVTAVGATTFINGTYPGGIEMASDQFGSGGGFSELFNQSEAVWQVDAVAKYLAMGSSLRKWPPAGAFSPTGRATPDVAALGEGFQVWAGQRAVTVGGTSASAPVFAGLVSLLNEARLKAGKPPMGFVNPFLYANPGAFYDVVDGTNAIPRGQMSSLPINAFGFQAAPGWDAATGLGTPHFDKLLAAAMAL